MNAPSPVHDEDQGEEVFLDESDIINEYDVDEEELPDADDGGSDGEEGSDVVDDSVHIFTGHTAIIGGHCFLGKIPLELLHLSWEKSLNLSSAERAEMLSTVDLHSCFIRVIICI